MNQIWKKSMDPCLCRDGEHEPERDPADEVEGKRLQNASAKKTRRKHKGISYLTTHNVYDGRKKLHQFGDGTSVKRWKRRSKVVAREFAFAEGKRDDISPPAT